tara:strand:- start:339 stop:851 length:513 start_codon:yes stop_codon:yes gene_type:complete
MSHGEKKKVGFRGWFYFRQGWSLYFAFIFAGINTLTVTYFLAIERYPVLNDIFPTFLHYVLVVTIIGVPLLACVGYVHFKRSPAYKSETAVAYESNPWWGRLMVNSELTFSLCIKLCEMIVKLQNDKKLTKDELDEITKFYDELIKHTKERSFSNEKDHDWFKSNIKYRF